MSPEHTSKRHALHPPKALEISERKRLGCRQRAELPELLEPPELAEPPRAEPAKPLGPLGLEEVPEGSHIAPARAG